MSVTKKRKLADDDNALVHITINEDGTTAVDISPKLDIFPPILLSTISAQVQEPHRGEVHTARFPDFYGPVTSYSFDVWTTQWDRRASSEPVRTLVQEYRSQSTANLVAMHKFQTEILSEQEKDEAEWVQLKRLGSCNPRFQEFHMLRTGDIGWGFDYVGNISLSVHRRVLGAVREFSVSVEANINWRKNLENEEV